MRRYLKHGVLAGMAGGVALAATLWVVGERSITEAIALENARHGGDAGHEVFGRGVQQAGGIVAAMLYGMAVGAVYSVVYVLVRRRLADTGRWEASVRLAGAGFAAVFLLPFLKYPANPPAVGDPSTVTERTVLYLAAVGWSVLSAWAGWRTWSALVRRRWAGNRRLPAAVAVALCLAAVGLAVLPANPDPVTAPASLLWDFRMSALAGAAVLWTVLGIAFGWLQVRDDAPETVTEEGAMPAVLDGR